MLAVRAFAFFILAVPVTADDCLFCATAGAILDGAFSAGEGLLNLGGAAIEDAGSVLFPPAVATPPTGFVEDVPNSVPPPQSVPGFAPDRTKSEDSSPTIELYIEGTPESSPAPAGVDGCDSGELRDSCGVATAQIIWLLVCGENIENANILAALTSLIPPVNPRVHTHRCGNFFYTATLTPKQTDEIKSMPGVEAIVPDTPCTSNSFSKVHKNHKKTQGDKIVVDRQAPEHLAHISTPPASQNYDQKYARFENAGEGIIGYIVDTGSRLDNDDITTHHICTAVIYSSRVDQKMSGDENEHGLCMMSLTGGARYGVIKKANLIMVKINLDYTSSFYDAFIEIMNHLDARQAGWKHVRGYTVIATSIGSSRSPINEHKAELLFRELIHYYQVVIITSSGNVRDEPHYSEINTWPAILALKPGLPIITVGAVDITNGETYPWSRGGSALTLAGPGSGWCAHGSGQGSIYADGTSFSAAIVAGEVIDVLWRKYLRAHLNLQENALPNPQTSVAQKVRDYLLSKAYVRGSGDVKSIWNGLWPDDPERVEP